MRTSVKSATDTFGPVSGQMFVASMGFLLVTGTVGFMCSWWFVLQIYGAVKVD